MGAIIKVKNVSKVFDNKTILDDISFDKYYFSKRIIENSSYLAFTSALNFLYESNKPFSKPIINFGFSILNKISSLKNIFIKQAMGKINLI